MRRRSRRRASRRPLWPHPGPATVRVLGSRRGLEMKDRPGAGWGGIATPIRRPGLPPRRSRARRAARARRDWSRARKRERAGQGWDEALAVAGAVEEAADAPGEGPGRESGGWRRWWAPRADRWGSSQVAPECSTWGLSWKLDGRQGRELERGRSGVRRGGRREEIVDRSRQIHHRRQLRQRGERRDDRGQDVRRRRRDRKDRNHGVEHRIEDRRQLGDRGSSGSVGMSGTDGVTGSGSAAAPAAGACRSGRAGGAAVRSRREWWV